MNSGIFEMLEEKTIFFKFSFKWDTGYGSALLEYQEGGSSHYPHGTPGPSHEARCPSPHV
jgi:hypothetical protein